MKTRQVTIFFVRLFMIHVVLMGGVLYASENQSNPCQEERTGHVDVFADFLYWHTTETIDWAFHLLKQGNVQTTTLQTLEFGWSPGFRVGIGYNGGCDWDTQAYYTHFKTLASDHSSAGLGTVQSEFLGAKLSMLGTYQTGKIDLKLDLNMLDWELGRTFCASNALFLRPMIGIKGGWIDQRINTKWEKDIVFFAVIPITVTDNLKNNFWGVGPKIGVDGKWVLGCNCRWYFSLFGDVTGAFMWGHWKITDEFRDTFQTTIFTKVRDRNFGALMLQGLIGIGFDYNFDNCPSHFSVKLGYEIEDWLNQYQVFDNGTGAHNNDLIFQGLTLRMRLDF